MFPANAIIYFNIKTSVAARLALWALYQEVSCSIIRYPDSRFEKNLS